MPHTPRAPRGRLSQSARLDGCLFGSRPGHGTKTVLSLFDTVGPVAIHKKATEHEGQLFISCRVTTATLIGRPLAHPGSLEVMRKGDGFMKISYVFPFFEFRPKTTMLLLVLRRCASCASSFWGAGLKVNASRRAQ